MIMHPVFVLINRVPKSILIFFSVQNMNCGYSLYPSHGGSSNEHVSSSCLMIVSYLCQNYG